MGMDYLTPGERRERLARLLLRGIYLYAQKEGLIEVKDNHANIPLRKEDSIRQIKRETQEPRKEP